MNAPTLAPGQTLLPYRVVARNGATQSDNRIHDDSEARAHGFQGGLVPGITTFSYMARPIVEAFGLDWLDRGQASIRLRRPVYEGEIIEVRGAVSVADAERTALDFTVASGEEIKATGTAVLLASAPPPVALALFPTAPLPSLPPPVSREGLSGSPVLGSLEMQFDATSPLPSEIDDNLPLCREAGIAHPALLLAGANFILMSNVVLGPWIHLASDVWLSGRVRHGDRVSVRGRVERLFEKNGRELVELDVLVVTGERDAVMRVKHTAIYRL